MCTQFFIKITLESDFLNSITIQWQVWHQLEFSDCCDDYKIKSNYIVVQKAIGYNVVHTFCIKITLESDL